MSRTEAHLGYSFLLFHLTNSENLVLVPWNLIYKYVLQDDPTRITSESFVAPEFCRNFRMVAGVRARLRDSETP